MTSSDTDEQFWFDDEAADRAVDFFHNFLTHVKGKLAGQPLILMDWMQDELIRPLFGWKRADGTRKYRTAYIEIPRKNAKSTLCAGIALYLLLADGEPGAEVYSAAADRNQAAIVFEIAKTMVDQNPSLSKRTASHKRSISVEATNSFYKVLSADAHTKHGFNAHGIVFDELHAQPNRELWDVLTTSTGSREQPLVVAITTAGYDRESVCWEMHEYARQVADGIIEDPSFFPLIYAAGEDDDWTDPETWKKANPGLGQTVRLDYLKRECRFAKAVPAKQNTFKRLHLNIWTQQHTRWLDMRYWNKCRHPVDEEALRGRECYAGLDLSSIEDVTALSLVFTPEEEGGVVPVLPFFWIPEENMIERSRTHRVSYDAWMRDGYIDATPGNVIDYGYILNTIEELGETYNIREIAFDRWGATKIQHELAGMGFTMVKFGQGYKSLSPPSKEFLRLVLSGRLAHGGNPVLRWMADNVVARQDPAGNVKPDKKKSREKIDGIVATVMGLDRLTRHEDISSVYEERGILEI